MSNITFFINNRVNFNAEKNKKLFINPKPNTNIQATYINKNNNIAFNMYNASKETTNISQNCSSCPGDSASHKNTNINLKDLEAHLLHAQKSLSEIGIRLDINNIDNMVDVDSADNMVDLDSHDNMANLNNVIDTSNVDCGNCDSNNLVGFSVTGNDDTGYLFTSIPKYFLKFKTNYTFENIRIANKDDFYVNINNNMIKTNSKNHLSFSCDSTFYNNINRNQFVLYADCVFKNNSKTTILGYLLKSI